MKRRLLIASFLFTLVFPAISQDSPYGTWKLLSLKGIDPDGNPMNYDSSNLREIKIITPTHFMRIVQELKNDSVIFRGSQSGKVKIDGNKYYEYYDRYSDDIFKNMKAEYTWKVVGGRLYSSGSATDQNGRKFILEEIVFLSEKPARSFPNNPAIGTWDQLSSSFIWNDVKGSHTNATRTRFDIITPTHWARIAHMDNKFESAWVCEYTLTENNGEAKIVYASFPINENDIADFTQKVSGNTLYFNGRIRPVAGDKERSWQDIFQRVD